jgi:hypothetical protein
MKPRPSNPATPPVLGSVHDNEVMPAREFCRRMGLAKAAWAELRRRGFPTIQCGKQRFVDGASALAYFRGIVNSQQIP